MSVWTCTKCGRILHISDLEMNAYNCPCGGLVVFYNAVKSLSTKDLFFAYHEHNDKTTELRNELLDRLHTNEKLKRVNKSTINQIDFWDDSFEIRGDRPADDNEYFDRKIHFVDKFKFTKDGFIFDERKDV